MRYTTLNFKQLAVSKKLLAWKKPEKGLRQKLLDVTGDKFTCRLTLKVKIKEDVVELKEDYLLFTRMCVMAKLHPEIDLKEAIGQ